MSGNEDFVVFQEAPESPSSDKSHSGLTTSVSENSSYQPEFSQSSEESSPSPNSNQEEISTMELQEIKNDKTNALYGRASKTRKMKTQPKPKPKKKNNSKKSLTATSSKKVQPTTSKRQKNEEHVLYDRRKFIKENQNKFKCQEEECSVRPSFALFEN